MITDIRMRGLTRLLEAEGLRTGRSLRNLGPTVVLAGPNGSGKSRFLRVLARAGEEIRTVLRDSSREVTGARAGWAKQKADAERRGDASSLRHWQTLLERVDVYESFDWSPSGSTPPEVVSLSLDRSSTLVDAS